MKYHTQWDDSAITDAAAGGDDPPRGWTKRFDAAGGGGPSYTRKIMNNGIGGGVATVLPIKRRLLRTIQAGGAGGRGVISWDLIDGDPARVDGEILALYVVGSVRESAAYLVARGSTGAVTGMYAGLEPATDTIRIGRVVAGVNTSLVNAAMSLPGPVAGANPASSSFWVRFRFQGANFSLTVWPVDTPEPAAPSLTTNDGVVAAAGFYGLWNAGAATQGSWNVFACCTGAQTVPRPRTESEFRAWCVAQNRERCVLAEITATGFSPASADYTKPVPYYISQRGYISQEQDTPSNRMYPALMANVPEIKVEIGQALRGRATQGFGTLTIKNNRRRLGAGGATDDWFRIKWLKGPTRFLIGDPAWPRHDFRALFVGRLKQPKSGGDNENVIDIAEISEAFDDPLQNDVFASGAGLNFADEFLPLAIGRPKYVEPPLYDSTNLKYKLHDGPIVDRMPTWTQAEDPLVMDDGNSLSNITAKSIAAVDTVNDRITVNAHGASVDSVMILTSGTVPAGLAANTRMYVITVVSANIVELSFTRGGPKIDITGGGVGGVIQVHNFDIDPAVSDLRLRSAATGRIVVREVEQAGTNQERIARMIDWTVFSKYGLSNAYRDADTMQLLETLMVDDGFDAGIWIDRKGSTVNQALDQITTRSNTWTSIAPDGVLEVGRIDLPKAVAAFTFTDKDVAQDSLRLVSTILPFNFTETRTRYRPVWLTGGPYFRAGVELASLLEPKYAYGSPGTPIDTAPQGDTQPKTEFDTIFEDGTLEQARLVDLFRRPLAVFSFKTHLGALAVRLGDTIQLTHPKKGWKVYTSSDPPGPDNPAPFDATKAVVIGKEVRLDAGPAERVELTVFRQLPQYAPEAASDMPPFDFLADFRRGTLVAADGTVGALTRATIAWTEDHEGLVRRVNSGEPRFRGWRREESLAPPGGSADFSIAGWVKTNMTVGGDKQTLTATAGNAEVKTTLIISGTLGTGDYRARFKITRVNGVGPIQATINGVLTTIGVGAATASFTAPIVSIGSPSLTWGLRIVTNGDAVKVEFAGLFDVSGRANQNPPEEIHTIDYGLGVAGVRVFNRQNGNTFDATTYQITDGEGAAISWERLKHLHIEPYATTNTITAPRDLTAIAWVKTNMNAARATGADGRASAGSSITATAAGALCRQVLGALGVASDRRWGVYLKRLVGVGTIEMTMDNGAVWVDVTAQVNAAAFTLVGIGKVGVTARTIGFRLGTNGDSIAVDFGLEEQRTTGNSSPIDTSAAATRNAEILTYATTALAKAQGVQFAIAAADESQPVTTTFYPVATDSPNEIHIEALNAITGYLGGAQAVSPAVVWIARKPMKMVHRWDAARSDIWVNGVRGTAGAASGFAGTSTTLYVGSSAAGAGGGCFIERVGVMRTPLSDDLAKDLST
jgi:hypothetical protein